MWGRSWQFCKQCRRVVITDDLYRRWGGMCERCVDVYLFERVTIPRITWPMRWLFNLWAENHRQTCLGKFDR